MEAEHGNHDKKMWLYAGCNSGAFYRNAIERLARCLTERNEISCIGMIKGMEKEARKVRALVWDAVSRLLPAGVRTYIVSDGALSQVSFSGLSLGDGKYLIEERKSGILLYPLQVLKLNYGENKGGKGGLVVAEMDYKEGNATLKSAQVCNSIACKEIEGIKVAVRLRGTERLKLREVCNFDLNNWSSLSPDESREAAEMLGKKEGATLVKGADASEAVLLRLLNGGFKYVHIATHGFSSPKECSGSQREDKERFWIIGMDMGVMRSEVDELSLVGLRTARANQKKREDPKDDGILSVRKVVESTDIRETKMLVLSSCQTALGAMDTAGEGTMGLTRAFEVAGASQVVASVWRVQNQPTIHIFQEFYKKVGEQGRIDGIIVLRQPQLGKINRLRSKRYKRFSIL